MCRSSFDDVRQIKAAAGHLGTNAVAVITKLNYVYFDPLNESESESDVKSMYMYKKVDFL